MISNMVKYIFPCILNIIRSQIKKKTATYPMILNYVINFHFDVYWDFFVKTCSNLSGQIQFSPQNKWGLCDKPNIVNVKAMGHKKPPEGAHLDSTVQEQCMI